MPTFTELLPAAKSSPHRAVRWTPDAGGESGTLAVDTARATIKYHVEPVPIDWHGRGFHLAKPANERGGDPENDGYFVFIDHDSTAEHQCDCKGFARWGTCKHVDACQALIENEWL